MENNSGLDRREFIAGTVALGAAVAGDASAARAEGTMATAVIDGLTVNYMTRGSGPPLLMLAPGGFDATMERWSLSGVWKGMRPFDTLSEHFTLIAYDRRESGTSGGRIERLSWALFADQAKALLDHLKISEAYIMGGCMGCSVALAFAARYPKTARALILHWPVGGYRWKINGGDRFARHVRFARENKLDGVIKRAHEGKSFWADPEAGPWASVLVHDKTFAEGVRGAGHRALRRPVRGKRTHAVRSRHRARRRAGGDHGHDHAGADHGRRRSFARAVGVALSQGAAAEAAALADRAAEPDLRQCARAHPRIPTYGGVTKMAISDQQHHDLTKNFLGKELYVIVTTPVAPREELDKLLAEHLAHQVRLEKQGIMFAAGPMTGEDGARVGGMIVIRAESFAAARAIADSDPYHKAGLRTYTLTRWTVNEGSYGIRVNYSTRR